MQLLRQTKNKNRSHDPVAERLTGWELQRASGRDISEIFVIVNAKTRKPAQIPTESVIAMGKVVGLASHTVLISRDGKIPDRRFGGANKRAGW